MCFQAELTTKSVCNMIRTRPRFHSLSFESLPQPAHILNYDASCQGHSQKMLKRLLIFLQDGN